MKSLLALTLLVSAAIAAGVPRHTLTPNYYEHLEAEKPLIRSKRASGFRNACPVGWTGQFCESPICHDPQPVHLTPYETESDKSVDTLYLPESCTGEYYVPYDSTTDLLTVTVKTDNLVKATAILTGPTGNTPNPISSEYNQGTATYRFKADPNPYVLSFTVDARTVQCIVHISARSALTFDGGWAPAPQLDMSPYGEAFYDSQPQYFIAHPFALQSPAEVKTVTIRQIRYTQPEYRSTLGRRYDCSYQYYAGLYQCTAGFEYVYQIEGIDPRGFAYRRSRPFTCLADTEHTVAPVTTGAPPVECLNGGSLLYSNNTDSTFCFCPELRTGKQCEEVLCMNGGLHVEGTTDQCDCQPGYVGRNCDNVVCDPDVGKLLTDTKTLAVIIRNTQSMAQHIPNIALAIDEEVLHHTIAGNNVYEGYVLVYVRDGVVYAKSYTTSQLASFGSDIENLATKYGSDISCTESLVPAITAVYEQRIMDQSPIFIFTDATSEQSDTALLKDVMQLNSANRMQLHTFFINTQANCKANPANQFYHDLARYTTGLVHQPSAAALEQTFQYAMRATTYMMNLVESADLNQCAMKTKSLIVDYSSQNLILVATGKDLVITVTDPDWEVQMKTASYDDGYSHFFIIPMPKGGEWLYTIQGSNTDGVFNPCSYRFYSQSEFDLFLATTLTVDMDERTFEPTVGQPAHLVAQVNGMYGGYVQDQFRLFAEILITSPDADDKHQPLYYSNGIFRSSCGFHLYFGVANFCQEEDQIFYATVFVDDQAGFPVQRAAVGYCNAAQGPEPPTDDCQNGGVRVNETTCWCPTHFTGNLCEVPECLNGGRLSDNNQFCICPGGVTGRFCEMMECTTKADEWEATFEHRTLNFVVSTRSSMKAIVKALADGASAFAGYYVGNHPTWIDHFAIVTVNQTGADLHLAHSADEFASVFREISNNFDSYTDYDNKDCTVLTNKGINAAIAASYENSNIFVFADSQADPLTFPEQISLLDRADELHTTVTLFGTSYDMCDGSGTFGDQEQNVVAFTGGKTFYTDNVVRVFDYIDTFYYSGVILEKTSDNCDAGFSIDFPLEASAHSVVVTTEGTGTTIVMSTPDNLVGLYHDSVMSGNKFSIQQYLQACPANWDTTDNMCYLWDVTEAAWISSLVGCGNANKDKAASLVTIFTDEKHDQVQKELYNAKEGVWIALYRDPTEMRWKWTQLGGPPPVYLDPAMEKYFAPNQDLNDPTKQYVYMKSDGLWYVDDTNGRHWTLCQRDRYGGTYNPEKYEPDLPAGFWNMQVVSSSKTCTVQVRTQSDVQIFFGFSQDPHVDFKRGTANIDSNTNYVVAKAAGLEGFTFNPDIPEGKIDYATIAADGNDVYPLAMVERSPSSCVFDSMSQIPFSCPTQQPLSQITVKFQGIDQFGYSFERALISRCDKYNLRCQNGGFANNGECVCPSHYNGDDCSVPICENGGTPLYDGTCRCPPLYTGQFCGLIQCDPAYPDNFDHDNKVLVIAVETSFAMATPLFYLDNYLVGALDKLTAKRPDWFDTYVFIPFDSTANVDQWYEPTFTHNYKDLDMAIDNIPKGECPGDPDCKNPNCPRPIGEMIIRTLAKNWLAKPDSVMVVISNSGIEDHNLVYDILPPLINSKAQLHFIVTPSASPCSLGWDDEMNKAMTYFASFTLGTVSSIVPKNLPLFFSEFLPSMYKAQEVVTDSQYVKDCSQKEHVFQIDHSANEFNMQFFGVEAESITITGPLGPVTVPPNAIPGSGTYFGVFEVDNQLIVAGTYIVRTKSAGTNCDLKVRSSTDLLVDIGFTQIKDTIGGNSQDDAHYAGLFGVPNKALFHVSGIEQGGTLQYAQVISPRGDVIATRSILARDSACTYRFVMDGTFDCDYQDLEFVVYGVDNQNSPFHRNFKAHCTDNRPQPIPPAPTCDLGALRADIAFLVDTSVDQQTVNWFQLFITKMMGSKFTLGRDDTQFGVMSLSDAPEQGGFFSFRFGNNKTTFVSMLGTIKSDGHVGQDVTSAIPALMGDMYTSAAGYRGSDKSVKKLLVYLTATEPTDDDPANAVIALTSNKITGFAMATYQIGKPSNKLKSLVDPACWYNSGEDGNGFAIHGPNFMMNLLCGTQSLCGIPAQ